MYLPKRFQRRGQIHTLAHGLRNGIRQFLGEAFQHPTENPAEPPRAELALHGGFVDGNNPTYFKRVAKRIPAVFCLLVLASAQNLELRLDDLQLAVPVLLDLAIKGHHLPRLELVAEVRAVKPQALQFGSRQPGWRNHKLEERHAFRLKQTGIPDFRHHSRHLPGAQIGQTARVLSVFVAKWQIQKEIADARNALLGQRLSPMGTNALDELHVGSQLKVGHLKVMVAGGHRRRSLVSKRAGAARAAPTSPGSKAERP